MSASIRVTTEVIEYRAAPYGLIAVIPKGTTVVEVKNLPAANGPRWWALQWTGMKESEESWLRNYGFLLEDHEVGGKEQVIEIHVRGGVAYGPEDNELPPGIRVEITDHDNH